MSRISDARKRWIAQAEQDLQQVIASRVPEKDLVAQLELFRKGVPFVRLKRPCVPGDGISLIPGSEQDRLTGLFLDAAHAGRFMKFVPASGAASRMFKPLLALLQSSRPLEPAALAAGCSSGDADWLFTDRFLQSLGQMAFYADLHATLSSRGLDLETLRTAGDYRDILAAVLTPYGLNYANLPKGLVKFHTYTDHPRTAFEEHLVETLAYCQDRHRRAAIHFTVSPDHLQVFEQHLGAIRPFYETAGIRLKVDFSVQASATDTIAVDSNDRAFRDESDELVFRPGGHGALIRNLNALEGDIVFLKNIDNVVPDHLKPETYRFKRILGGFLVDLQGQVFTYLEQLTRERVPAPLLAEMTAFAKEKLSGVLPATFSGGNPDAKQKALYSLFNRPLRVCGMVRNQGEPGGGPFWVAHASRPDSLQVVETSQIDQNDPGQMGILRRATHFNPVDIVCGIRDFRGRPFDLDAFVDPDTAFIATKSKKGRALKALELPGLWNGGMAGWNTVFVEVPLTTFNLVKTVNDFLRPGHQPAPPEAAEGRNGS